MQETQSTSQAGERTQEATAKIAYWPVVSSQYGTLSRGRHSARQNGEWAETARGQVTIPANGYADKECTGISLPSRFTLVGTRNA